MGDVELLMGVRGNVVTDRLKCPPAGIPCRPDVAIVTLLTPPTVSIRKVFILLAPARIGLLRELGLGCKEVA